jgi:hypothetical protein
MLLSIIHSARNETGCSLLARPRDVGAESTRMYSAASMVCEWQEDTGLNGGDLVRSAVMASKEQCGQACVALDACAAADWNGRRCFLKGRHRPFVREGGHTCHVVRLP